MNKLKRAIKYLTDDSSRQLAELTGWDVKTAKSKLRKAKMMGISDATYMRKKAYQLSDEDLACLKDALQKAIDYKNADERYYADLVKLRTGWSDEETKEKLAFANSLGIKNMKYVDEGMWLKSDDELRAIGAKRKEFKDKEKDSKEEYLKLIMEKTGWTWGKAEYEVLRARGAQGASYEDFYRFKFYERSDEDRLRFPTLRVMERFRTRYCSYEPRVKYFDDKAEFNRVFGDKMHRVRFTPEGLTYEKFKELTKDVEALIVKPVTDACGNGISKHVCHKSEEEDRKIYDFIMGSKDIVVEECVKQHPKMAELCDTSVNTVRINTMHWNGECVFQFAILRTGTGDVIDNFHNGGIAARVDVETGIVNADAIDLDGNIIEKNPYSGMKMRGFQIPHWDKLLETCRDIDGRIEGVDYVGWDFAITEDGVELIEGNEGAYVMPQMCNLQDDTGLLPVLVEPYMDVYGKRDD